MISKHTFIKTQKGCFCQNPELIENYDLAISDETQMWECHHRLEEFVSKQWLIDHNDYYNVSPNELIFLTKTEHRRLHRVWRNKSLMTEEIKKKISETKKKNPIRFWKGKNLSEETKRKISESKKGSIPWNKGLKMEIR